jgi:hypothetical protein
MTAAYAVQAVFDSDDSWHVVHEDDTLSGAIRYQRSRVFQNESRVVSVATGAVVATFPPSPDEMGTA